MSSAADEATLARRMAHLHLRTGLPALALVELETLAGRGELDTRAWTDLAEARWRGGDLSAAADAARAHLDQGGDDVMAEVVAVEALAAAGDHREARRLAQRVLARADVDEVVLDRAFAGHPRSAAWPARRGAAVTPVAAATGIAAAPTGVRAGPAARATPRAPRGGLDAAPGSARPGDDIAAAEAALARGETLAAAGLLAVALREEPALAAMTLSVAERGLASSEPVGSAAAAFQLVRGDALRLLGRAGEASAAFQGSRRALVDAATREEAT